MNHFKSPSDNIQEARHYKSKKNSDIVNFPSIFRREVLSINDNPSLIEAPITIFRILFKVLNDISHDQFNPGNDKQRNQLELFDEDLMSAGNTYARFTFKVTDISSSRDYEGIQRGLEYLENLQRGWHKTNNRQGKVIKSYGGIINNSSISTGKITFLISNYWLEKLLSIPSYNVAYFKMAWKISTTKQMLFFLWLLEIPDKGTKVSYENNIKIKYGYEYTSAQLFGKHVLKPMKATFDKNGNKSFNYSTKGDIINIFPYYTADNPTIQPKTIDNQKITQRLHYWKVRHNLKVKHINSIKKILGLDKNTFILLEKSYKNLISMLRKDNQKATDYKGDAFIILFQECIKTTYQIGAMGQGKLKDAYPIITE